MIVLKIFSGKLHDVSIVGLRIITSAREVMFLPDFVCLSVCEQDNSKSYGRIFLKFSGNVGNGKNYQ